MQENEKNEGKSVFWEKAAKWAGDFVRTMAYDEKGGIRDPLKVREAWTTGQFLKKLAPMAWDAFERSPNKLETAARWGKHLLHTAEKQKSEIWTGMSESQIIQAKLKEHMALDKTLSMINKPLTRKWAEIGYQVHASLAGKDQFSGRKLDVWERLDRPLVAVLKGPSHLQHYVLDHVRSVVTDWFGARVPETA